MKISSGVTIKQPIQLVWEYMNDRSHMKEWQQGYTSSEHISGEPLMNGARARHTYTERGKPFVMTETILNSDPPRSIEIMLEHPAMNYAIITKLISEDADTTHVTMDSNVTFKAFSFKVLKPLLKKPFQKRQDEDLQRLKVSLEKR
jgi:uncharacterized protein YndB with AHSA1/START domain